MFLIVDSIELIISFLPSFPSILPAYSLFTSPVWSDHARAIFFVPSSSISRPKTDFSLTFALCLKFSWFCQLGYYYPRRDFLPLQATITARWVLLDTSTSWDRWELCSFGLLLIFYLNFHRGLSRFYTCFWELRFPSRNHQRSLDIGPWFGTCWQFLLYFCSRFCGICLP